MKSVREVPVTSEDLIATLLGLPYIGQQSLQS